MRKKQFKKIYIEITNICNLSCDFCLPDNRKKEYMAKDKFEYILNQIKDYTDYIYLHVKGEPLIHPEINQFIQIAYDKGFNINITTNGTKIESLETKNIRQINYSMQSTNNVMEIQKTIKKLKAFILDTNIYLSLRLWRNTSKQNLEIEEMIREEFQFTGDFTNGVAVDKNIYLSIEEEFIWPDLGGINTQTDGYCYGLKNHIAILVDGTVVPCCLDHRGNINLGNIFEENLSNILNTERARNIGEGFKNRKAVEELCKKCGFKSRF